MSEQPTLTVDSLSQGSRGYWSAAQIAGRCPERIVVKEISWPGTELVAPRGLLWARLTWDFWAYP